MNKRNKKKGFTLIELIVVMAIIAVLAAIAVPQLMKSVKKSKITADVATAKAIANSLQQYISEGNLIETSDKVEIKNDGTNVTVDVKNTTDTKDDIDLSNYIDNAKTTVVSKVDSSYKFFYSYDKNTNEIKIYAGKDKDNAKEIYPTLSPNY